MEWDVNQRERETRSRGRHGRRRRQLEDLQRLASAPQNIWCRSPCFQYCPSLQSLAPQFLLPPVSLSVHQIFLFTLVFPAKYFSENLKAKQMAPNGKMRERERHREDRPPHDSLGLDGPLGDYVANCVFFCGREAFG